MKFSRYGFFIFVPFSLGSCGSGSGSSSCTTAHFAATSQPNIGVAGSPPNVIPVVVNGSTCTAGANRACVSVTICSPSDPSNCQTLDNIILDTGSYGLRIFSSAISLSLSPLQSNGQTLAECAQFGNGSESLWGPVEYAYVKLGSEPAVNMPLQIADSTFGTPSSDCSTAYTGSTQAGFNGILGVGLMIQDCASNCVTYPDNSTYFSCSGSDCSCGATVDLDAQVSNPVALLPIDNNGVLIELPSVGSTFEAVSLSGTMYLGLGTQSNNSVTSLTEYAADTNGNFQTLFDSSERESFIDSGTSTYSFPTPGSAISGQPYLVDCGLHYGPGLSALYCPSSVGSYNATILGASGSGTTSVSFQIGNAYTLLTSSYQVFSDLGADTSYASLPSQSFVWGLPFFFGRPVAVGIEGQKSTLGTGPYWGF